MPKKAKGEAYYERAVPPSLADLLKGGGALAWLPDLIRSTELGDLQLRADRSKRAAFISVYAGGSRILDVRLIRGRGEHSAVRFRVAVGWKGYREIWPGTGPLDSDGLAKQRSAIERYIGTVISEKVSRSKRYWEGEAKIHSGLMRRYGLSASRGTRFLVVDREIVIGNSGLAAVSNELDAVAILRDGSIALVELKAHEKDIAKGAKQLKDYVSQFRELAQHDGFKGLQELILQKQDLGLLPPWPAIAGEAWKPRLHPVLGAPGPKDGWQERWRGLVGANGPLKDLQFWLLSEDGELVATAGAND